MNERIKELCEQVGITWKVNWRHQDAISGTMTLKQFEKFAELIVRECVQLCQECIDDGCVEAQEPMEKIKQHFGVEE
jgi:hypothetical protein